MLTEAQIRDAADQLYRAEQERRQIPAVTLMFPDMDMEDAYRVQKCWVDRKIAEGRSEIADLEARAKQPIAELIPPQFRDGAPIDQAAQEQMRNALETIGLFSSVNPCVK